MKFHGKTGGEGGLNYLVHRQLISPVSSYMGRNVWAS